MGRIAIMLESDAMTTEMEALRARVREIAATVEREADGRSCKNWPSSCRCSACCCSYEVVERAAMLVVAQAEADWQREGVRFAERVRQFINDGYYKAAQEAIDAAHVQLAAAEALVAELTEEAAMTLTDEIAAAEQRARDAVIKEIVLYGEVRGVRVTHIGPKLDRYAAACKLAGRWDGRVIFNDEQDAELEAEIAAELAALVQEMEP